MTRISSVKTTHESVVSSGALENIQRREAVTNLLREYTPKFFKKLGRIGTETTRWLGISTLLAIATIKTPGSAKVTNDFLRLIGKQPSPTISKIQDETSYIQGVPVDSFVNHYPGFAKIQNAIEHENIKINEILKDNEIAFDEPIEFQNLKNLLKEINSNKYSEEINLLDEIHLVSQLIWGPHGLSPNDLIQGERPNCQAMADIQSLLQTQEGIQKLKSTIYITSFKFAGRNIEFEGYMDLNDNKIPISFEIIKNWMSPREITPSYSGTKALYVPILTKSLDQASRPYGGIPSILPSSSMTLVTREDYSSVLTTSLSNQELKTLLSKAPQTPVRIATATIKWDDIKWNDVKKDLTGVYGWLTTQEQYTFSDEKAKQFIQDIQDLTQKIINSNKQNVVGQNSTEPPVILVAFNSNNIETLLPPPPTSNPTNIKNIEDDIYSQHVYTVKETKEVNGEFITTIIDSHGGQFDLTLEQMRRHSLAIISKSENSPNIGQRGLIALLLASGGIFLIIRPAANKLNKLINPGYENKVNKLGYKIIFLPYNLLNSIKKAT